MWWRILLHWQLAELDLHQTFGIDLGDRDLLRRRSWRWLQRRALALPFEPGTRLQRVLRPKETPVTMLPTEQFRLTVRSAMWAKQ